MLAALRAGGNTRAHLVTLDLSEPMALDLAKGGNTFALSIGSVVALSALVTAEILRDQGIVLGVAAGLGVGLAVGALNGAFLTLLHLPSFLVKLASTGLVAGLARSITDLRSVAVADADFAAVFGTGDAGPVPGLALWGLGAVALGHVALRHRRFGAHVLATGDDERAARISGIHVGRVRFAVLVLSGGAAALAGILYTGRLQGATYSLGEQDLLVVIAAVVIGGTRLFGGEGSVAGALCGRSTSCRRTWRWRPPSPCT